MAKLHELLATDGNLKGQAQTLRMDLQNTFEKKRHLFSEKLVTFNSNQENVPPVKREQSDIQSTIRKEVEWLSNHLVKSLDAAYAIDVANTIAKADIVLENDVVIAKDVPSTALLQLEKRMKEIQEFVKTIPTLDPAKGFRQDEAREKGVYAARDVEKDSSKKIEEPLVLYPATDKHPAQVQMVTKDVKVGTILEQEWSSLITPATKADLLERSEILLRAVSKARARANEQDIDVKSNKIGRKLLEYVFLPLAT